MAVEVLVGQRWKSKRTDEVVTVVRVQELPNVGLCAQVSTDSNKQRWLTIGPKGLKEYVKL